MMQTQFYAREPTMSLEGTDLTFGLVVARYNWSVTGAVLALCQQELLHLGVAGKAVHVVYVPGSYELPTIAQAMLIHQAYDALICIGCVMKGETRHDVVVEDAVAYGIQRVSLDTGIPIILGVLCVENQQQAEQRITRGKEFAQAAVDVACMNRFLRQKH
ncbi:6,7-dimethyl-8-ribityllumazine synthase [Dictyobacter aurantiacus]|uniref:6,7-dimethyl-8-ribityllumazine synthase n=1 Tax=Dictyobacter aurantiacus TaxID=1936993 RepID=A0A401Z7C6_9CHLR|nr:6,7-dimethyl-8-ribityllumazine synthase [Dictyobacter aurantiacus]GCE02718.1 6,7-dimethyl-8-ribityllumazine synthase [Dictyobacter aurantiacus]